MIDKQRPAFDGILLGTGGGIGDLPAVRKPEGIGDAGPDKLGFDGMPAVAHRIHVDLAAGCDKPYMLFGGRPQAEPHPAVPKQGRPPVSLR